ncbi:MAG: hypothetical protein ACE5GD_00745 [Candidatus Geothermarchaeales archaeon]
MAKDIKNIRVVLAEERLRDGWFDLSLRELREGVVHFYRVKDPLTGNWLFKVCFDEELSKIIVKAIKCPPGILYSQLEGNTMLFQKSLFEDLFYDIISLTYVDEERRVRRRAVSSVEEIPTAIRDAFEVKTYEEAKGRKLPREYLVTLHKASDVKGMVALFILERAWPLLPIQPELALRTLDLIKLVRSLEKAEVESVFETVRERFGIEREDVQILIDLLEKMGKLAYYEPGYVKTL